MKKDLIFEELMNISAELPKEYWFKLLQMATTLKLKEGDAV